MTTDVERFQVTLQGLRFSLTAGASTFDTVAANMGATVERRGLDARYVFPDGSAWVTVGFQSGIEGGEPYSLRA